MLVFCKLGGSLITDKNQPHTARLEILDRLTAELAAARRDKPDLQLVLGHGSGSFGHVPGKKFGTRQGVNTSEQWHGFVEVWYEARALNEIVLASLQKAGLPVISFPPSACAMAHDGTLTRWDLSPLKAAVHNGIIPLVYGDTCFDTIRGGTIVSTEDIFAHIAPGLKPDRILLAGIEPGVWSDFPRCTRLIDKITLESYETNPHKILGSAATDVTGGMEAKVRQALKLVGNQPGIRALIFSGMEAGNLYQALSGSEPGTVICR